MWTGGPGGPVTLKPFTRAYVKVYNITGPTGPHVLMFYIFYCVNFIAITLIYSPSAQSYASYLLADSLKSSSGQQHAQTTDGHRLFDILILLAYGRNLNYPNQFLSSP